jgi:hypothetical protein
MVGGVNLAGHRRARLNLPDDRRRDDLDVSDIATLEVGQKLRVEYDPVDPDRIDLI